LELQDRVIGLAAGVALALLRLRLSHGLDVSTEILPWHDLLDRFQRIAQSADRLQPALNIEKALLPHDPLAPSAHDRLRSPSQIRGDLARGIFRGARMNVWPRSMMWLGWQTGVYLLRKRVLVMTTLGRPIGKLGIANANFRRRGQSCVGIRRTCPKRCLN